MEALFHILGTCSDTHTHFDLLDLLVGGVSGGVIVMYLKIYFNTIVYILKDMLPRKK